MVLRCRFFFPVAEEKKEEEKKEKKIGTERKSALSYTPSGELAVLQAKEGRAKSKRKPWWSCYIISWNYLQP